MDSSAASASSSAAAAAPPAAVRGRCILRIRFPPGWRTSSAGGAAAAAPPAAAAASASSSAARGRCIARIRLPPAWTAEEDARLERLAKENVFRHWHRVARQMPGRSPRMCRNRWREHLARHVYHRPFTAADDEELRRLVARLGSRWEEIGRAVYGRTSRVMRRRWKELRNNKTNNRSKMMICCPPPLPLLSSSKEEEEEEEEGGMEPDETQQDPTRSCVDDDVLASSLASFSLSTGGAAVDPRDGSLALGFACMAV